MSTNRKFGGTGLGLSIAQQLVDAHAGKLELESREGEGTTVVITLPVLQPETRTSLEQQFRCATGSWSKWCLGLPHSLDCHIQVDHLPLPLATAPLCRAAYVRAGHSFDELMNPDMARAEGRRSVVFRSSQDRDGKVRRASNNSHQYAVREREAKREGGTHGAACVR